MFPYVLCVVSVGVSKCSVCYHGEVHYYCVCGWYSYILCVVSVGVSKYSVCYIGEVHFCYVYG